VLSWYAIYTNPRAEKKVAASLTSVGIEVYLPLQTTLKQWSDRKKKVEEVLFKSYVFIRVDINKHYYDVLNTPGVVKFVRIGAELVPIRQTVIDSIKLALQHFSDIEIKQVTLEKHQEVEVQAGPLKGLKGFVVNQENTQHFTINIDQLGTSMHVKVPANYLLPIT
jgi:transcriptional antiterminator RfaH